MKTWWKRMGCLLLAALLLWTAVPTQAFAAEPDSAEPAAELMAATGTYKYYHYEVINESHVRLTGLTITDEERKDVFSVIIPSEIDGYPVKEIGGHLFRNCPNLNQVTIPDSIEVLGCGAFLNCTSLTSVYLPRQVAAGQYAGESVAYPGPFSGSGLADVTFGAGWTSIPNAMFQNCSALQSIVLPDTITDIGRVAFQNCKNLKNLTLPANLEYVRNDAFINCTSLTSLVLPETMKEIEHGAFRNCTGLASVHIPAQMVTHRYTGDNHMYPGPFQNCTALKTVTFSPGRTSIPRGLFLNCTGLEEITLPDGITSTAFLAFGGCTNLKKVNFCDGLTVIGTDSFKNCVELSSLEFPESLTTLDKGAFFGCTKLTEVVLPDGLKTLGIGTFQSCTGLTRVYIPAGMKTAQGCGEGSAAGPFTDCSALTTVEFAPGRTEIPSGLFYSCPGLRRMVIPDSITIIRYRAFRHCKNLKEVVFNDGLQTIDQEVFWDCDAMETLTLPANVFLGNGSFTSCDSLTTVYVPAGVTTSRFADGSNYSPGAFHSCNALEEVVFDEACTIVPTGLFTNCSKLESVIIPESVTEVQKWVFKNCTALKQVYFRGNGPVVTAADNSARSFPKTTVLYAMQNKTGWTDNTAYDAANNTWNGYELKYWNGVLPQIDSMQVPEGKYCFLVVDEDGNPIEDVQVTWEAQEALEAYTDETGCAFFPLKTVGLPTVTVEKDGYTTWTNLNSNWEKSEYRYDIVVLYPEGVGQLKLQSARFSPDGEKWPVNVLVETKKRTLDSDADLVWDLGNPAFQLSCRAFAPELVARYELWQDLTMVAESKDGIFADLSNDQFQEGANCYVRVVSTDGSMVDTAINLEFVKAQINKTMSLNLSSDSLSFEVPDSVPFVGGATYSVSLPLQCPLNLVLSADGKYQIGFNVNVAGGESEQEQMKAVRKFLTDSRKLKRSFSANDRKKFEKLIQKRNSCKFFQNGEINFVGYAELDPGSTTASGCVMLEMSIDPFTWNYNTLVPVSVVIVPVTVQVKVNAELVTVGTISYDWTNATFLGSLDMNPSVGLTVFGGFGTSGIAGIGAYGSAVLANEFRLLGSPKGLRTVDLTGELGIKAYVGMFSAQKPFAYNTWHLYSATGIQSATLYEVPEQSAVSLFEAAAYEVEDLSYLMEETPWLGAEPQASLFAQTNTTLTSLLEDTYRNAQPVMAADEEAIYAAFLRADAQSSNVYAAVTRFDGQTWAEPVRVDAAAILDNAPSLCVADDGAVWLAYARTEAAYNGTSLLNYAENQSIVVGRIDPQTLAFTECGVYAADGYARLQQLAVVNGVPTLVWADSGVTDDNSVLFPTDSTIRYARWSNGAWSDSAVLSVVNKPVLSLTVGAAEGGLAVACLTDTDGSAETREDRTLLQVTEHGVQILKEGAIGRVAYGAMPGSIAETFLWNEGADLCSADGTTVTVAGLSGEFVVVGDRIYYSSANDSGSDLVFVQNRGGVWSVSMQATSGGRYLENLSVVSMGGEDYVMGMHTDAAIGQSAVTDRKNLVWSMVLPVHDLRLDDVQYDAEALSIGQPMDLVLTVTNAGESVVSSVAVSVGGSVIGTQTCDLQPGQTTELTVSITCPAELKTYAVAVATDGVTDYTPENNKTDVKVGYADVAVALARQTIGAKQQMMAYVMNNGIAATSGVLRFYVDGLFAGEQAFSNLNWGETTVVTMELTDEFLGAGDQDITAEVLADTEELYTYNNTQTVYIGRIAVKTAILSAERSGGTVRAEISYGADDAGTAVIAAYGQQGQLREVYLQPLQLGSNTVKQDLDDPSLTDVRIMVLDENHAPQCKAKPVT